MCEVSFCFLDFTHIKNIKKVVALITSMILCMTGCGAKEQANVETEDIAKRF